MKHTLVRQARSIAGTAFVGLGIFIVYQDLASAAVQVRHVLGGDGAAVLGLQFAVVQWFLQITRACSDHGWFLAHFLPHTLVSSWPLLVINMGSLLSRDTFKDNSKSSKKDGTLVDLAAGRSTSK